MKNLFSKGKADPLLESQHHSNTIIGKGTEITGDLNMQGNVRIDGKIIGNLNSIAKISLGKESIVEGNIYAQNLEVQGEVTGNLEIMDTLILKSTSLIVGSIISRHIITESGAQIDGKCVIRDSAKQVNLDSTTQQSQKGGLKEKQASA